MLALLIVLQVIVAVFLILVVLLQPGNRGGMGAALGGAGGETMFGGRGANTFLSKLTFGAAAVFMITSISLSFQSMPDESVVSKALKSQGVQKSETPAEPKSDGQKDPPPAATPDETERPDKD